MDHNMTSGNPAKVILTFMVPVLLGNIFQQMYNMSAAVIVGHYLGEDALAAVGVANPIMSIVIFFIFGICVGMSVLMAQLYGAGDEAGFKLQASTSLISGLVFSVVLSVICIFFARPVLILTKTPVAILDAAEDYVNIIFIGMVFSFLYNYYAAALRAIGDSKTPFLFLLISSVLNIGLVILFVTVIPMGVAGAAVATVIAQAVSSVLCIFYVYRKIPLLALKREEFIFNVEIMKKTISYSWVSAVQQTFLYVGRLLVQGVVNPFGTTVIAAYNAATRVEAVVFAPFDSMSISASTFCAQNMGAGTSTRIKAGFKLCILINLSYGVLGFLLLQFFSPWIMSLFIEGEKAAAVVAVGVEYLTTMSVLYIMAAATYVMQGLFRGVGRLNITMIATAAQIVIRVIASYLLVPRYGMQGVAFSVGLGWIFMLIYEGICAKRYFSQLAKEE